MFLALLACLGAPFAAKAAEPPPRPNIVFILVDDLRFDALGCTGHPFIGTPNIDRIAAEGVLFRNAFVTTPLCSPSRASILTGRYAASHGIQTNRNDQGASRKLDTFPLLLQRAGYATAYMGKWHMGNDDSPRPGFDRWISFKGQGVYVDPPLNIDGKAVKINGYMTDILTDHAAEFISRKQDKPFCLYLSHKAVHGPFTPAERHKDLFAQETVAAPPADSLEGKPALKRDPPPPARARAGANPAAHERIAKNQLRALMSIDEGVGRLLKVLSDTGQLDNTLVIFTSDNGFFWGEHGLGDKRAAYEESIRVPLLMRYPRLIPANVKRDQLVLSVDIAPTLLELAGVAIPRGLHGRSLVPLLREDVGTWRESILAEYFNEPNYRIPGWQAVRTKRWKYIHYTELEGMDELYDLQDDPHELKNLIKDPGVGARLKEMRAELERLTNEAK